jgi:hypothetical protein
MQGSTPESTLMIKGRTHQVATFSATVSANGSVSCGAKSLKKLAGTTGLEPATSCVTAE